MLWLTGEAKLNFINERIVQALDLSVSRSACNVSMAQTELKVQVSGSCTAYVTIGKRMYTDVGVGTLPGLCRDLLLGQDFQQLHKRVIIEYGDECGDLIIANKGEVTCALPLLMLVMHHFSQACHSFASLRFSHEDKEFSASEIQEWLTKDIIE